MRILFSGLKKEEDEELEKLKLEHVIFPFCFWAIGLLVSMIVFIVEKAL